MSVCCSRRTDSPVAPRLSPTNEPLDDDPEDPDDGAAGGVVVTDPLEPPFDGEAAPPAKPRYLAVFSVTTPVGLSPFCSWKRLRTLVVDGPNTPSAPERMT
jgi:hypothetical protein